MDSNPRPASAGDADIPTQLQTLAEEFYATDHPMFLKLLKVEAFVSDVQSLVPPMQESDVDDLIESIETEEFPAKRLKLELANLLRRPLIILEYMKKEEKLLVKRALQFKWIYFDPCSLLTSPKTVTRILLPSVSFATRMKVIRGLSKYLDNEKSAEKMFPLIQEKYGVSCALELLPACSRQFIQDTLGSNRSLMFLVEQQQSLRIVKKDYTTGVKMLEIIYEYLKSLSPVKDHDEVKSEEVVLEIEANGRKLRKRMKHHHHKTIEYLSIHHTKEFVELFSKYSEFMQLKPKPSITRALFRNCANQVVPNGRIYKEIICHKILHKCLSQEELIEYATSSLPDNKESFFEEFRETLGWVDQLYCNKWKVVEEAFKRKYKVILESQECLPLPIMRIMPSEMRQVICREKVEKVTSSPVESETKDSEVTKWIVFCSLEVSIPKLKGLVSQAKNLKSQRDLGELLVESCYLNGKHVNGLVDVGRFLTKVEGDCGAQMRYAFTNALTKKFPGEVESSEIKDLLCDFVKLYCVQKDTIHPVLLCSQAHGELLFDSLTVNELQCLIVHSMETLQASYCSCDIPRKNLQDFVQFVLACCTKKYPENVCILSLNEKDRSDLKEILMGLINFTCKMKLHINVSDWLKNRILEIIRLEDNFELDSRVILSLVKNDMEFYLICLQELLVSYPDPEVLEYFLRKNPETIYYNIESILSFILSLSPKEFKIYRKILFKVKSQSYSALQSTMSEICLETVQNEGLPDAARENAITTLSILWDSTNFLHIISLFHPISPFAGEGNNLEDDEIMDFESKYRVKKIVVESLKNTSTPTSCLKPLGNFCVGDYVKISLGSLYSSCLNARPSDTIRFLRDEMLDSPLSLKKHAIKLLLLLSTKEDVEELLMYLWESETHLSVRRILVSSLCAFASQNYGDTTRVWGSVIRPSLLSLTTVLDSTESESLELLKVILFPCNVVRIPYSFIGEFLQICVNIIDLNDDEKSEMIRKKLKPYLVKNIHQFSPAISQFQRKFLMKKQYIN